MRPFRLDELGKPIPRNGTRKTIETMAGEAASLKAIARRLHVTLPQLKEWLDRYPKLQNALDAGREAEHKLWYDNLRQHAARGPLPAIFMLKTRHGYQEGVQQDQANRVNVVFNLPGAQPLQAFLEGQGGRLLDHKDGGKDD